MSIFVDELDIIRCPLERSLNYTLLLPPHALVHPPLLVLLKLLARPLLRGFIQLQVKRV